MLYRSWRVQKLTNGPSFYLALQNMIIIISAILALAFMPFSVSASTDQENQTIGYFSARCNQAAGSGGGVPLSRLGGGNKCLDLTSLAENYGVIGSLSFNDIIEPWSNSMNVYGSSDCTGNPTSAEGYGNCTDVPPLTGVKGQSPFAVSIYCVINS